MLHLKDLQNEFREGVFPEIEAELTAYAGGLVSVYLGGFSQGRTSGTGVTVVMRDPRTIDSFIKSA